MQLVKYSRMSKQRGMSESRNKMYEVAKTVPTQLSLLGNRQVMQHEPNATKQVATLLRNI